MALAELVTIGNEILDGRVTDTNRVFLGRRLKELGFEVRFSQSVDDDIDRIVETLNIASKRSDLIVCTGGLGPTSDDLTAQAVAKFLSCACEVNAEADAFVREVFKRRSRPLSEAQLKQTRLPKSCKMIANPVGTAPGFYFEGRHASKALSLYSFPGVPQELFPMFEATLATKFESDKSSLRTYTWSTVLTSEGELQRQLTEVEKLLAPFRLGFRTKFPENFVTLMGRVENTEAEAKWRHAIELLQKVLSPQSYAEGAEKPFIEHLVSKVTEESARLIFVESCTGGLLSHLLTELPGVSKILWGSQVCYANEEKLRLGVSLESLKKYGAVSEAVALEMAMSGLERLKSDSTSPQQRLLCLSTTGIAGPGGATAEKPVGLMYTALAQYDGLQGKIETRVQKLLAPKFLERKAMKIYMAYHALEFLRVNILPKS